MYGLSLTSFGIRTFQLSKKKRRKKKQITRLKLVHKSLKGGLVFLHVKTTIRKLIAKKKRLFWTFNGKSIEIGFDTIQLRLKLELNIFECTFPITENSSNKLNSKRCVFETHVFQFLTEKKTRWKQFKYQIGFANQTEVFRKWNERKKLHCLRRCLITTHTHTLSAFMGAFIVNSKNASAQSFHQKPSMNSSKP